MRAASADAGESELARAFHSAQHDGGCREPHAVAGDSTEDCSELRRAVRTFVVGRRADGSPPERVLADIKYATRRTFAAGGDELHGDGLQTLILREFLASYFDAAVLAEPAWEITE